MSNYINLAEQFTVTNLGIFKISLKENNQYKPSDLSKEGFPIEQLVALEIMAELIISQPYDSQTSIDYEAIEQSVRQMCIRNI